MKDFLSFIQYLTESENIEKNLPPLLKDLFSKYGEQLFEESPTFNPLNEDLKYIFDIILKYGFNGRNLKHIPIKLLQKLDNPKEIAAFTVTLSIDNAEVIVKNPEIEILDISPFFIYQLVNIIAHEIIHYDDYVNGAGEDAAKTSIYGQAINKKAYNDHGILFTSKMQQLNDAFGLNIQVKYDKNADQHLDKNLFINPDRKTVMKREIAQALNFDRKNELDSHILFEDEENLTDQQIELVRLAREMLKKHPGADVKINGNSLKLYIY